MFHWLSLNSTLNSFYASTIIHSLSLWCVAKKKLALASWNRKILGKSKWHNWLWVLTNCVDLMRVDPFIRNIMNGRMAAHKSTSSSWPKSLWSLIPMWKWCSSVKITGIMLNEIFYWEKCRISKALIWPVEIKQQPKKPSNEATEMPTKRNMPNIFPFFLQRLLRIGKLKNVAHINFNRNV